MGWWLLAVGSPLGLAAIAAVLLRAAGHPWPDVGALRADLANPGWVANLVAASVAYGIGEEPGWRGFALPRLQASRSALRATLLLTVLWASWHAPFFTYRYHLGGPAGYAGFFVCFVAGALWLTFLYNSSGGSILMVILWHLGWNAVNVAGAAVSDDLVAVTNVLVIPLGLGALAVGGARRLSWSEKQVIQNRD
jgi:CAAX protease family protein